MMKRFLAALRFLTILPVPSDWGTREEDLARSVPFFVLIGLLAGAAAGAIAWGLAHLLPQLLAAVLVALFLVSVSGGLHLDGLSDTADAFFSSKSRERMLEIMKDSRAGPMGVAAIVFVLALKIAALASIPTSSFWRAAFLMPVAGRCALPLVMALLPYVRSEGGLGSVFTEGHPRINGAFAVAVLFLTGWLLAGMPGLYAGATSVLVTVLFAFHCHRKICGATGDTYGAACEIAEIVPALVLSACHGV